MTATQPLPLPEITLLVLAGGKGSRMGGRDKGLVEIAGKPAIEHLLERFSNFPGTILISANRNLDRYAGYGHPVVSDARADFPGPLAGMLAGLEHAPGNPVLTLPVDAPLVSEHYPERMASALAGSGRTACVASFRQRIEPVFCLLDKTLAPSLRDYLEQGGRAVNGWLGEIDALPVDFSDTPQQFINLNVEQDQKRLMEYLSSSQANQP